MLGDDPQVNRSLTTAFAYLLLPQIIFYGLSSVFMAILNTRNVFGPPAWAPVVNNVVAIGTLGLYLVVPGELSLDPVEMGNGKLLVLGIGTTLGVVAQTAVLFIAIRRERVSLRPLWGLDARIKKFGTMAGAMVLYVLISQAGLVVGNQIASTAAASGPAIYNYTWLVLMLPFGMIGVTVLTVVMPRLSRNAAADDQPAVLADLSFATRLTLMTLIPVVAFMTVAGPAIGSALFAYGNFGDVDAGYLGMAITLSAFTLIPYSMVLLQLRVFYAREQPWTPILLIAIITAVKVVASLATPMVTDDPEMIAGYLGLANGLGFLAGAVVGHLALRANLKPPGGRLIGLDVVRTILVTIAASLAAGLVAHAADRLLGLESLTEGGGGAGSILRLLILGVIMLPIIATVLLMARVPDALAAAGAVRRRLGRSGAAPQNEARVRVPDPPRGVRRSRTLIGAIRPLTVASIRCCQQRWTSGRNCRSRASERISGDRRPRRRICARRGCYDPHPPAERRRLSSRRDQRVAPTALGPPARRLRRRPHARTHVCRHAERAGHRSRHRRRRRPPHPRCDDRRGPVPPAGVPRRSAASAVLARHGHHPRPPGGTDLRRPRGRPPG